MKKQTKFLVSIAALGFGMSLASLSQATALNAARSIKSATYFTDFTSLDDAKAAAADLAVTVAAEGDVLLKNKNQSLPLTGNERVSVFGTGSDYLSNFSGAGYQLTDALADEGFKVNPTLKTFYGNIGTTYGTETTDFGASVESSMNLYGDVAVVVVSRAGGEGMYGDNATVTSESLNDEEENVDGWKHANAVTGKKHFLQFTDSEVELLNYVKGKGFKKIVYLINSSSPLEVYNLENDDAVNGILWIGRPGQDGIKAAAKILAGEVNPSGKTVDTWYTDFTSDPTWQNATSDDQVGTCNTYLMPDGTPSDEAEEFSLPGIPASMLPIYKSFAGMTTGMSGIDYEEDIYLGYKYYETRAYEMNAKTAGTGDAWYDKAVTYPYGYGLSYTSFKYSDMKIVLDNGTELSGALSKDLIESYVGHEATVKKATAYVKVTNTGNVAGKETVELYATAPYNANTPEKAYTNLIAFGKTEAINPGASETIAIEFNLQDIASYDYLDKNGNNEATYELDAGAYSIMAMGSAHEWAEAGSTRCEKVDFSLAETAVLKLDDYSGEVVGNLFTFVDSDKKQVKNVFNSRRIGLFSSDMTFMSRADLGAATDADIASFPSAPTTSELTMTQDFIDSLVYWNTYKYGNDSDAYDSDGNLVNAAEYPWVQDYKDAVAAGEMDTWTQATDTSGRTDGKVATMLSDMAGIDPYDGGEGTKAWNDFLNQLTWDEITQLTGKLQKADLDSIGMKGIMGADSTWNFASTYCFTDNCILGATWNVELSKAEGQIIADLALLSGYNSWWGNGAQVHRSLFAGRIHEYMSEDGIHSGYMSAAETKGCQSKGVVCYVKHSALNDQETNRCGYLPCSWESEQAMRERSLKPLQMCVQEGGAQGIMGAFARIGQMPVNANYNAITKLFRGEWGNNTISITTDAYAGLSEAESLEIMVRAGTDNLTQGSSATISGTWDASLRDGKGGLKVNDVEDESEYYYTRKNLIPFLYMHANSSLNKNGVDLSVWSPAEVTGTQGSAINADISAALNATDEATYEITDGELPAGLSLSRDGHISGTTNYDGEYTVTVKAIVDGWITSTKSIKVNVGSIFAVDGELTVDEGEEIDAYVYSTNTSIPDTATYSVTDGELPAGITLESDGTFAGKATAAGTYTFTVACSYMSGRSSVTYYTTQTIVVNAGEAEPEVETKSIVSVEPTTDGYKITFTDGSSIEIKNGAQGEKGEKGDTGATGATGADGKDGKDGADGKDGEDGKDGADATGCGGSVIAATSSIAAVAVLGLALAAKKREEK